MIARNVLLSMLLLTPRFGVCESPLDKALPTIQSGLVSHICQDGGAWMRCFSLRPSDCRTIMQWAAGACLRELKTQFAVDMENDEVEEVGTSLSKCLNTVFLNKYGIGRVDTPECEEPPAHLR